MEIKTKDNRVIGHRDRTTEASPMEKVTIKTLRDQFAMAALTTINITEFYGYDKLTVANNAAEAAYRIADAMLEERSKRQ